MFRTGAAAGGDPPGQVGRSRPRHRSGVTSEAREPIGIGNILEKSPGDGKLLEEGGDGGRHEALAGRGATAPPGAETRPGSTSETGKPDRPPTPVTLRAAGSGVSIARIQVRRVPSGRLEQQCDNDRYCGDHDHKHEKAHKAHKASHHLHASRHRTAGGHIQGARASLYCSKACREAAARHRKHRQPAYFTCGRKEWETPGQRTRLSPRCRSGRGQLLLAGKESVDNILAFRFAQRPVRTSLEPRTRRVRTDRRSRTAVDRGAGRLLRNHGRLPRHGGHPPIPGPRLRRHGRTKEWARMHGREYAAWGLVVIGAALAKGVVAVT